MLYLANAFSLQMIPRSATISVIPHTAGEVAAALKGAEDFTPAIGHADTAAVVSRLLGGLEIPAARINISLKRGDVLFVAQIMGGRLPEGATTLPEGFDIEFRRVEIL